MKFTLISSLFALGILLWGCSSENVSGGNETFEGRVNGVSQKGPFLEGSSVVMQELDGNSLAQTGKSFRGKVINDKGDFSIENVSLDYPYALLEVNGYYRNEVTGKKSNGSIFMKALADVSGQSKVNINLLTHLEYERVQNLMNQNKMSIEEAKRQADREIFSAFYADVDYDKVEYLSIFGNGEGDAALLAINILLLGEESEASFMERFASMGQDLATDGVWNDSLLKIKIADFACQANLSGMLAKIRENIESWKIADVPAFESYVNSFWVNQYGLGKCDASNIGMRKRYTGGSDKSIFHNSAFKCSENGWVPYSTNEVYSNSITEECSAKNEGEVKVVWEGNPKYGYNTYNRCENGLWVRGDISLTCDTAGARVGDICRRTGSMNIFQAAGPNPTLPEYVFVYAGNGVWESQLESIKLDEECVKDNVGKKKISSYGDKRENTYYLECTENGWQFIDEGRYHCGVENAVSGDVCSFSVYGDSVHYIYYPVYSDEEDSVLIYGWEKCNYDSVLGCCPNGMNFQGYNPEIGFRELGGKSYYCNAGEWISTTIVPHQYTDSRKEGLTDMEYDILDLPKEASVGDRAGGLLESCSYGVVLNEEDGPKQGTFNYCVPQTYYRYRGDGSWTKETIDEFYEDQISVDDTPCGPSTWCCAETEGLKNIVHMDGDGPDRILQCDSGKIELVDYVLGRYEEK